MKRVFTKKFLGYHLGKTGKDAVELLDMGAMNVGKMIDMIVLGNAGTKNYTYEEASKVLDDYLEEGHSLLEAEFQLMAEYDADLNLMRSFGIDIEDMKNQILNGASEHFHKIKGDVDGTVLKEDEAVKIDEDGFATID